MFTRRSIFKILATIPLFDLPAIAKAKVETLEHGETSGSVNMQLRVTTS
jgi:hypothetical protein